MCQAGAVNLLGMTVFGIDAAAFGVFVMVVATALLTGSNVWLTKANPNDELPSGWGRPPVSPIGAMVMRGAGAGLAILGVVLVAPGIGWTVVLVLVMFLPFGIINVRHNAKVRASEPPR